MSGSTFEGWSYWSFPLGDGWLVLALALGIIVALVAGYRGWLG